MRRLGHSILAIALGFGLLGVEGEEILGHHHAFSEEDLVAHSLVIVDHPGEAIHGAHLEHARDASHSSCPACTLSAGHLAPSPTPVTVPADDQPAGLIAIRCAARELGRHVTAAPARGPPFNPSQQQST